MRFTNAITNTVVWLFSFPIRAQGTSTSGLGVTKWRVGNNNTIMAPNASMHRDRLDGSKTLVTIDKFGKKLPHLRLSV